MLVTHFCRGKIEGVARQGRGLKGANKASVGLLTPCSLGARVKLRQIMTQGSMKRRGPQGVMHFVTLLSCH